MLKKISISLCLTLAISLAIGFVLQDFFNSFWKGTVCSLILHFIGFYFFSTKTPPIDETQNTLNDIIELQTCPVSCPCGNNTFNATVFLNTENMFTCDKCQGRFKVDVTYDSVLVTEPISITNVFNSLKNKKP